MKKQIELENPLLQEWSGPYGGVPDFTKYKISDFKPAIEFAIQEKLNEIEAIANNLEVPTFENTIIALELSGEKLERIHAVYGIYRSNLSSPEFNVVDTEMSPKLAEISDKLYQNEKLFSRIEKLYKSEESKKLTAEQQRLLWLYYTDFVREGAELNAEDKKEVASINQELAGLFTLFSQKLLAEENDQYLELNSENDLEGLPEEFKNAAIAEAKERKLNVLACIGNTRSSIEPFLTFSDQRKLREQAFDIFVKRGDNDNSNNTNATLVSILQLRAKKARILGFKNFAEWSLSNKMAKDPQKTLDLMHSVWKPAVEKVKNDVSAMQKIVDDECGSFKIQPWDYRYYAEKVRKAKYDLDQNEIKQYLQLENLREGMFWTAGELFDLGFKQVFDVPVYHSDVRVWEVNNKNTGAIIGLWYFDPYARVGKRSGAWMNSHRDQQKIKENVLPIVSNNCNFIKGNSN
ncbi:MAG TPA: M3 family metallopeptidase, partial [Flavobacterium sp.]|nr:M3 family metallopeptidase [Flavobacterium sp.]